MRGFAVASTDTGHQGRGGFDASFMQDQQASLDFAYAAIGRVAEVAKRIVAQHYGKPAARSYFAGCSTGGREAMLMAQRYPTYFDGVVSGAPAMRTSFSGIGDRWVAATLNEIARVAKVGVALDERKLPVPAGVRDACGLLGLDPMYVANEGKLVAFVGAQDADAVLAAMREHPLGARAAAIGVCVEEHPGMVVACTALGGTRVVDLPVGEQLPRIC
jgi:hypothetical protein